MILRPARCKKTEIGTIKVFDAFAWLPTTLSDGSVIWLMSYKERCEWSRNYPLGKDHFLYFEDYWETLETYLEKAK